MDPNVADVIIDGLVIAVVFLTAIVLLLIACILGLVERQNTTRAADKVEEALVREVAGAERRIERLVAEAQATMFEEAASMVQDAQR